LKEIVATKKEKGLQRTKSGPINDVFSRVLAYGRRLEDFCGGEGMVNSQMEFCREGGGSLQLVQGREHHRRGVTSDKRQRTAMPYYGG